MKKCKHSLCEKDVLGVLGLRDFCSDECKKAHRKAYYAKHKQEKRNVHKSSKGNSAGNPNVHKSEPTPKPFYKLDFEGQGHLEVFLYLYSDNLNKRIVKVRITPTSDENIVWMEWGGMKQQRHVVVIERYIQRGFI